MQTPTVEFKKVAAVLTQQHQDDDFISGTPLGVLLD
jgi:hypothetical protein